jgi:hypothetical protein
MLHQGGGCSYAAVKIGISIALLCFVKRLSLAMSFLVFSVLSSPAFAITSKFEVCATLLSLKKMYAIESGAAYAKANLKKFRSQYLTARAPGYFRGTLDVDDFSVLKKAKILSQHIEAIVDNRKGADEESGFVVEGHEGLDGLLDRSAEIETDVRSYMAKNKIYKDYNGHVAATSVLLGGSVVIWGKAFHDPVMYAISGVFLGGLSVYGLLSMVYDLSAQLTLDEFLERVIDTSHQWAFQSHVIQVDGAKWALLTSGKIYSDREELLKDLRAAKSSSWFKIYINELVYIDKISGLPIYTQYLQKM